MAHKVGHQFTVRSSPNGKRIFKSEILDGGPVRARYAAYQKALLLEKEVRKDTPLLVTISRITATDWNHPRRYSDTMWYILISHTVGVRMCPRYQYKGTAQHMKATLEFVHELLRWWRKVPNNLLDLEELHRP